VAGQLFAAPTATSGRVKTPNSGILDVAIY
jgi:hypothetical protein